MRQFCDTSSFFKLDNIKNEAILRDFLQKWKVACNAEGLVPMSFAIFPVHLSKLLRLPRKSDARSYEVLHLSRKIISANLKIWCSKMHPFRRKSTPGPPNSSDEHVSCTAPAKENASFQILFKCPTPAIVFGHATKPSRFSHFRQGAQSLAPATRNDIWTSKSAANMWCFVHFDFEMCFAPQRRTLFWHLNFQKWSVHDVFCTFWLRNVFRATTACTFSTSQPPKVVRTWCVLYLLTSKCASRHNGVHFFDISTFKSVPKLGVLCIWLGNVLRAKTACTFLSLIWPDGSAPAALASLLFDPPEPQIIGKTQCVATFLPFRASASSFFWLFLFSDLLSSTLLFSLTLPISAFHLSILSEVWLLNFLRWCCMNLFFVGRPSPSPLGIYIGRLGDGGDHLDETAGISSAKGNLQLFDMDFCRVLLVSSG